MFRVRKEKREQKRFAGPFPFLVTPCKCCSLTVLSPDKLKRWKRRLERGMEEKEKKVLPAQRHCVRYLVAVELADECIRLVG
ncbi:hypothetical protein BC567DRAFT_61237 [Phyllosticta citribraziliensis]